MRFIALLLLSALLFGCLSQPVSQSQSNVSGGVYENTSTQANASQVLPQSSFPGSAKYIVVVPRSLIEGNSDVLARMINATSKGLNYLIEPHPDALTRINSILFTANNSVRHFFLAKSYGKFNLGAEEFIVNSDYPTIPSVIQELGTKVNWSNVKGVIAVNVNVCTAPSTLDIRDGGGIQPQEFETPNGNISLEFIYITACGLYPVTQSAFPSWPTYILTHELSHSVIMFGHANIVESLENFQQILNSSPGKLASLCSIPFNASYPEIRSFSPPNGCKVIEYGDQFDILGDGSNFLVDFQRQFSVYEKQRVGWIPETTTTTATLASPGTYDLQLYPHDLVPTADDYLFHIKIPKGPYGFYSVEYRAKLGELFPAGDTRVLIRYGFNLGSTFLIAALAPGEAYTNPADKFSIRFNSVSQPNGIKTANIVVRLE